MTSRPIHSLVAFLLLAGVPIPSRAAADDQNDFVSTVGPIFRTHCQACHGKEDREAELDLSSLETVRQGSEAGAILDVVYPDESRLLQVLVEKEMPPEGEGTPLSDSQIEVVRNWIRRQSQLLPAEREISNQQQVQPILLAKCAACHGRLIREAELDVRSLESLLRGGRSGPAIVPSAPEESLLLQKIHDAEMPPRSKLAKYSVKPVTSSERQRIEAWIAAGAPWEALKPDVAGTHPDPLVSDEDREHWSFQPPVATRPASMETPSHGFNTVDSFVRAKLRQQGLTESPRASNITLLRRLTFDLTGLPPSLDELEAMNSDTHPMAYERVVDRLLASPAYGERWGQYWLDLAGYADSEGVQHADPVRPHAYRFRDYVIRSLNSDKPYDRFLLEQIAGDELVDYENAETITQEIYDNLVATAFLRMSSDGTFAGITGFLPNRLDVIDDQIRILSSSVMGLTLRCARCHSHKFDAIPQRDYYRLAAIFKGAVDEFEWLSPIASGVRKPRYLPHVMEVERDAWQAREDRLLSQIEALKARQKALADVREENDSNPGAAESKRIDQQIKDLESQRTPRPMIRALWDEGEPSPTYLLRRGDYRQPGRVVGPGVPSVLTDGKTPFDAKPPWPGASKTGNRLALARWLVSERNPLTARVIVNRVWKHHFGRGLVETLDDFGVAGARPTHPRLLDWLAVELMRNGWSMKWLQRMIVTSETYCQTSQVSRTHRREDPDNRWLTRMPMRRMEAEVLRDTLIEVAGQLDRMQFGPPAPVTSRKDGLVMSTASDGGWRRSVYVQKRRTERLTILDNFDRPRMSPNCVDRASSNVAPQALHLMNNGMVQELSEKLAQRVRQHAGSDVRQQCRMLFLITLSRPATGPELELTEATYGQLREAFTQAEYAGEERNAGVKAPELDSELRALAVLCHSLMNSAEFLYID